MVEVVATDEFQTWYESLDDGQMDEIDFLVGILEERGVTLGHPHSSSIKGSEFALRELRGTVGKHELRVIYAFDPRRDAVLILGGDKGGDKRFYERTIEQSEGIWKQYLSEQGFTKPQK